MRRNNAHDPWAGVATPLGVLSFPVIERLEPMPVSTVLPPGGIGGACVGKYRLLRELGRGAMSRVHLAEDERGVEVAVKVLHPFGTHPGVTPESFDNEVRLSRLVRHANLVQVLDAGVTDAGEPFIVMERLRGQTLGDRLRGDVPMAPWDALAIVREAARGLAIVHQHGLVHRDVKPDNLFLCDVDHHGVSVKVLDFGFMTVTQAEHEARVCGTLEYIAPEQAVAESVDRRADVYALGVVLFRMLTGELPFDACARRGILAHHLTSAVPPPSWLQDGVDDTLDAIVATAVRKHPANRYASMEALLEDIDRALTGEPVHGAPQVIEPDRYLPRTELGQRAVRFLSASI
jgi:eukaryotic-like serine/threonine-protein kinase